MKSNLVIIPAGPTALFQQWTDYSNYNFDLAIINWSGNKLENIEKAVYYEEMPGQKWKLMYEFDKKHDLSQYEYIWCLDDDCATVPDLIQSTFDFCVENDLDLAQPALESSSYYSHIPTLMIPNAKMHIVNTVEIMCPIFRQRVWKECIEPIANMPLGIGYGFEGYWQGVLKSKNGITKYGGKVAVIDRYPVLHTQPVTQLFQFKNKGLDPDLDGRYFYNLGYPWSFDTIEVIYD
jgi:hypothetical protein